MPVRRTLYLETRKFGDIITLIDNDYVLDQLRLTVFEDEGGSYHGGVWSH